MTQKAEFNKEKDELMKKIDKLEKENKRLREIKEEDKIEESQLAEEFVI